jgi:hypothetical protein
MTPARFYFFLIWESLVPTSWYFWYCQTDLAFRQKRGRPRCSTALSQIRCRIFFLKFWDGPRPTRPTLCVRLASNGIQSRIYQTLLSLHTRSSGRKHDGVPATLPMVFGPATFALRFPSSGHGGHIFKLDGPSLPPCRIEFFL